MTRQQAFLLLHTALLFGALLLFVPPLIAWDARAGYLFTLVFYWVFFCMPVIGWHALPANQGQLFSERLRWRDWWLLPLLLLQVSIVASFHFVPSTALFTSGGMWLALLLALINGPLEEIAWRGGFLGAFRDRPRLGFWLCWLLFSAWHLPLVWGTPALLGDTTIVFLVVASALGLLWTWISWRTGSVFYVSIAHALTNIFSFWLLIDRNLFAS
jgi:membrane protease YdiL (CAAX protease family)